MVITKKKLFFAGRGNVIVGLDIALSTMKRGEVSRFHISPKYAYGLLGCPPRIPPNASILYEVELLSVLENSHLGEYEDLNEGERERLPFHKVCYFKLLYHEVF